MAQAKIGDTVRVHYTGKLDDGTVFDTSLGHEPLEFTIGDGRIIPGFEKAVIGMSPDESKTIKISYNDAYGPYFKEMVIVVSKSQFPPNINPEVGQQYQVPTPDGRILIFKVTDMNDDSVTLDANHPLAGKDLIFEIKLVSIV